MVFDLLTKAAQDVILEAIKPGAFGQFTFMIEVKNGIPQRTLKMIPQPVDLRNLKAEREGKR